MRTLLALSIAALIVTCGGDEGTEPEPNTEDFSAALSSNGIVGATVTSNGTGSAAFSYDGTVLSYSIDVQSMDAVIAAHIHGPATRDQNADVVLTLFSPDNPTASVNGRLVTGTVTSGSALLTTGFTLEDVLELMRGDDAFVMVHSSEYPDGEIRGHVELD